MREITPAICERLEQIRRVHYGERGRSRFARDLGLTASTYAHYETDRLPPVDILLRAARLTRTRLEWLITGEHEREEPGRSGSARFVEELVDRLRHLLGAHPDLAAQADRWLRDLESNVESGPIRPGLPVVSRPPAADLIPVVGSTSAGMARFWDEIPHPGEGRRADARLETLLASCSSAAESAPARFMVGLAEGPVSLVQLSRPDEHGLLEFLHAPLVKSKIPRGIAWRIDGDSMQPRFQDGDFVIASPETPAEGGHPCIARQAGQIGVNCKVFQQEGDEILLIPLNQSYPVQRIPRQEILWAWRVLASVRLAAKG